MHKVHFYTLFNVAACRVTNDEETIIGNYHYYGNTWHEDGFELPPYLLRVVNKAWNQHLIALIMTEEVNEI